MDISKEFNRFYHGAIIKDFFNLAPQIRLDIDFQINGETHKWRDDTTGDILTLIRSEDYSTVDELKQALKYININYPIDDKGKPISTNRIDAKRLSEHIEFIFKLCSINYIELPVVKEEWELLIQRARESGFDA